MQQIRMKSWRTHPAVTGEAAPEAANLTAPIPLPELPIDSLFAKPKPARAVLRPCLRCRRDFRSEGFHNRLCDACRRGWNPLLAG